MTKDDINHIISHTHWDREWYLPFQNFRFRLVKTIDRCIEIFNKEIGFKHFNLDGQTIVLEDYLEIKPENKKILTQYIKEGKIGIGPWYLQCSPWLQTGEGIIRNLLYGYKMCERFQTKPVNLGYIPDQFIMPPMLPQIFKGFNIENTAFTRTMNDQYEKDKITTEFYWESPDGSKVLAFHLRSGYGMAGFLPNDPQIAINQIALTRGQLESAPRSTKHVLMFNGSDHTDPDENLPEIINIWNNEEELVEDFGRLKQSTWNEYISEFKNEKPELKTIAGELSGVKYHFASKGVFSNRMPIKQANFYLHSVLERFCEPFNSINWLLGGKYKSGFLTTAWKYLLQNQPHDSSWGASPDAIIKDMWTRFRWVKQISEEIFRRSAHELISRMDLKKYEEEQMNGVNSKGAKHKTYRITVFNPSPWPRTDHVEGTISIEKDDYGKPLVIKDSEGNPIASKFIPREPTGSDRYLYRTFVGSHGALRTYLYQFKFLAIKVPPLGYETYNISVENDSASEIIGETYVNAKQDFLENDVIKVLVEKNGTLTLIDKELKLTYKNLNLYCDTGNKGCGYEYIPLENDKAITTEQCECKSELYEACPAYSEIKITIPWKLPESIKADHSARTKIEKKLLLNCFVRIYPGNRRRIDIRMEFTNLIKWHQLKAVFPTELNVDNEFVDAHFHVFNRPVDTPWDFEGPYATTGVYPQHKFMGIYNSKEKCGIAIINKGLPAYETVRDKDNNVNINLILFRAQGQWNVHDNIHPNILTPDAQWLNRQVKCEYAIFPMKNNWLESNLIMSSEEFILPLRYEEHWDVFRLKRYNPRKHLPVKYSLFKIVEGNVRLTSIKKAEKNQDLIIRIHNLSSKNENVKIEHDLNIAEVKIVNLNEERIKNQDVLANEIERTEKLIKLTLKPFKIITLSMNLSKKK
ncbi:MAG: hypothetical protein GF364_21605 [Candidatus Lokiarchaeota archaeon]|nr:hypothetical protein [Candidatus Lokiarchaeota archaeon]